MAENLTTSPQHELREGSSQARDFPRERLVSAFGRLRTMWKSLAASAREASDMSAREGLEKEPEEALAAVREGLEVLGAAARISEEARPFVELAYRVRLGVRPRESAALEEMEEVAEAVGIGFEMRMRTLKQMESGAEVLPEAGTEVRRSAARDLAFFRELGKLVMSGGESRDDADAPDPGEVHRLARLYDGRRRLVREELAAPDAAVEAVEFLVRLEGS